MTMRKRGPRKHQKRGVAKQDGDMTEAHVGTSTKTGRNAINNAAIAKPSHDEVLEAVASLYADELKPFGRILRKRIAERFVTSSLSSELGSEALTPIVDIDYIKATCEDSKYLKVQPEEGGDWSALIIDRLETFVDVYSSLDKYPSEMWQAVATYFENIAEEDMKLPGGRYSCAQVLLERSLPFLHGRSLGQVCHIVQLAMSRKKILGYSTGFVVPYAKSQSALKDQCAMNSLPCTTIQQDDELTMSTTKSGLPMATWDQARHLLCEILEKSQLGAHGVHEVPLSNVKRLFRSVYNVELSETMLGHSKLSELLQDERFSDICTVRLQAHGYTVVQVPPHANEAKPLTTHDGETDDGETAQHSIDVGEVGSRSPRHVNKNAWPSLFSSLYENECVGNLVQRTFIHASLPPPSPLPQARRRSSSLPKNAGSYKQQSCVLFEADRVESSESTRDSDEWSVGSVVCSNDQFIEPLSDEPIKIQLHEGQLTLDTDPLTLGDVNDFLGLVTGEALDFPMDLEPRQHFRFCIDEPLALEVDTVLDQEPLQQDFHSKSTFNMPSVSPSLFVTDGCIGSISLSKVRRTFIHSPLPPPTPLRASAARRSRSLPKDAGSDKDGWEATCQALGCSSGHSSIPKQGGLNFMGCDQGLAVVDTPLSQLAAIGVPDFPDFLAYVPPSPALTASPVSCQAYGFAHQMPWTMDGQILRLADHL